MKSILTLYLVGLSFVAHLQPNNFFLKYNFTSNFTDASINSINASAFSVNYVGSYQISSQTAANFNGTNAYGSITTNNTIKRLFPISIGFWINFSNDGEQKHVFKSDVNNSNDFGYWVKINTNNSIEMGFGDGGLSGLTSRKTKTSVSLLAENTWQHVVCIFKSTSEMEIIIDCQNAGGAYSGTGSNTIQYDAYSSQIGRDYNASGAFEYSSFKLDELTMYSRELNASEINLFCDPSSEMEENIESIVNIYPNPTKNAFYINFQSDEKIDLKVLDMNCKLIAEFSKLTSHEKTPIIDLDPGVYIVNIQMESGRQLTKRLIVD
jgi:Concanavalin A-like lectin/glucanases superfamily/Secretion system C-terminal sorting domain